MAGIDRRCLHPSTIIEWSGCRTSRLRAHSIAHRVLRMRRGWVRVFAGITLVAFMLANGPVLARPCQFFPPTAGVTCRCTDHVAQGDSASERCECCCCRDSQPEDNATGSERDGVPQWTPSTQHDRPDFPACPCPGGCAYCNVAKVPCPLPAAAVSQWTECAGPSRAEAPSPYFPPCSGTLLRPPRG